MWWFSFRDGSQVLTSDAGYALRVIAWGTVLVRYSSDGRRWRCV